MLDARRRVSAVTFPPLDNPDWDHARNRRFALRSPHAEWCQSALSDQESDGFYYHRSEYAYEGLLVLIQGDNWKTLERMGFRVLRGSEPLELKSEPITATPDWVLYRYSHPDGRLTVRYQVLESPGHETSVLTASYSWEGPIPENGLTLELKPILDMRHMFYFSDPDGHHLDAQDTHSIRIRNHHHLEIASDRAFEFHADRQVRELCYPMGSGDREEVQGEVHFKREGFRGTTLGHLSFELDRPVTVFVGAGSEDVPPRAAVAAVRAHFSALSRLQEDGYEAFFEQFKDLHPTLIARLYVMAHKFGMAGASGSLPESGGWWFRASWLRPVFAGLLHNHVTLGRLGRTNAMEALLRLALRYQDPETGRLPNRLPEHKTDLATWAEKGRLPGEFYHGADSLLLMFTWLSDYLPRLHDRDLLHEAYLTFKRAFASFQAPEPDPRGEVPVLTETGLLLTQPGHSWINGRRSVWVDGLVVGDLPIRVDRDWQVEAIQQFRDAQYTREHYQQAAFYLPEINAQWIRTLEVGMSLGDMHGDDALVTQARAVYDRAIANYKRIFWNSGVGFLYNLITKEGRPDPMVTSPGIEAVSLLGGRVFTRRELASVWSTVKSHLLVKRDRNGRPAAFGVLAKDSSERIFYGDAQYHEAVCWPRETPHLLRILSELGEQDVIEEILETNLGHQMDEGVIFYANEILSLPEGINPAPTLATGQDPVPVKNPMQWASLWCDPYLARA